MKRQLMYLGSLLIMVALLVTYACQKEGSSTASSNSLSANSTEKNAVVAATTFESLNNFAMTGFTSSGLKAGNITFGSCPTTPLRPIPLRSTGGQIVPALTV